MERNLLGLTISLIKQEEYPQMKLEAIWIIANVTYGDKMCKILVEQGVIDICLNIVKEGNVHYINHALVALGNIAADQIKFRDTILKAGGLEATYMCLNSTKNYSTFENCIWLVTNLCRGTPPPTYQFIDTAIPFLCKALQQKSFGESKKPGTIKVISDVIWTLSGFS